MIYKFFYYSNKFKLYEENFKIVIIKFCIIILIDYKITRRNPNINEILEFIKQMITLKN